MLQFDQMIGMERLTFKGSTELDGRLRLLTKGGLMTVIHGRLLVNCSDGVEGNGIRKNLGPGPGWTT
jgi:hypothetical protein